MFSKKSKRLKMQAKADKKQRKADAKELERCARERVKAEALAHYYSERMNELKRR